MSVLVGKKAPDFTTQAVLANGEVVDNFNLTETIKGKFAIVFFYPLDFTFVCPSELLAMHSRMDKFKSLGVEVIGISIDSHWTHNAWRNTAVNDGGIGAVDYTLAADMNHAICSAYGIESDGGDSYYPAGVAMRASFVIDQKGVVRSQVVNDEPLGRNMDELVRTVESLQFFEENGQVCPAGWNKGDAGMTTSPEGVAEYLTGNGDKL
jgi:peroxiredoxin 2/4